MNGGAGVTSKEAVSAGAAGAEARCGSTATLPFLFQLADAPYPQSLIERAALACSHWLHPFNAPLMCSQRESVPWTIDTKYYTADVELTSVAAIEWAAPADAAEAAVEAAEALMLVLDATDTASSLAPLAAWKALAHRHNPACMLCVVNKVDVVTGVVPAGDEGADAELLVQAQHQQQGAERYNAFLDTVREWCLDHGFEHVECAATSPLAGAHARDKAGVPRVLEALQSTPWSNMVRRRPGAAASGIATGASTGDAAAGAGVADASAGAASSVAVGGSGGAASACSGGAASGAEVMDAPGAGRAGQSGAPDPVAALRRRIEHGEEDLEAALDENENDSAEEGASKRNAAAASGDGVSGSAAARDASELQSEPDIGRMMEQMRAVRAQAVSGALSDAERRAAAERMAMQLFALLGADDESDNDGDDSGRLHSSDEEAQP